MQREPEEIPDEIVPAPVVRFAKGDYVVFMWEREGTEPDDDTQTYAFNFFDVMRVENGLVQEHWDSVYKTSTELVDAGVGPASSQSAQHPPRRRRTRHSPRSCSRTSCSTGTWNWPRTSWRRITSSTTRTCRQAVPGSSTFFSQFAQPEPIMDEWKDEPELTLVSDDLVLYMFKRFSVDPADPSRVYKWNWFDLFRIEDGLVQEHWDMATKAPTPDAVPLPAGFVEYR